MRLGLRAGAGATALWLVVAGCASTPVPSATPSATGSPPSVAPPASETPALPASPAGPSATPIALPSPAAGGTGLPPQFGLPSEDCVKGWQSPAAGSPVHEEAVEIVQQHILYDVPVQVEDIRYFTGPDVPWIIEPHYEVVERWYVKTGGGTAMESGRWLIEKRTDRIKGVSAVAPYDSSGYRSPDWVGFVGDGPPVVYDGLPGAWAGIAYDFVTGEGDSGQPGLPDQVAGCLDGS